MTREDDLERESAFVEARLAESLGRLVMQYEAVSEAIATTLEELCLVGIHDYYAVSQSLEPRVRTITGHLSFRGRVMTLDALWDADRIGVRLEPAFIHELLELDDARNRVVHASWWAHPSGAWRTRFHRRSGMHVSEPIEIDSLDTITERLRQAATQVWRLRNAVEEAEFREAHADQGEIVPVTLHSAEEFIAFANRFPDATVQWAKADPLGISIEMTHPFGRRGSWLAGEWAEDFDPEDWQGAARALAVSIKNALDADSHRE